MSMSGRTQRVLDVSKYMISEGATVRSTAHVFGLGKSTVHRDVTEKLPTIDEGLFLEVRKVLQKNKAKRHSRGGLAARKRFNKF